MGLRSACTAIAKPLGALWRAPTGSDEEDEKAASTTSSTSIQFIVKNASDEDIFLSVEDSLKLLQDAITGQRLSVERHEHAVTALQQLQDLEQASEHKAAIASTLSEVIKLVPVEEDEISGVVSDTDDSFLPVNTFRSWVIGLSFSLIGAAINNFFAERLPGIAISGYVAQLLAYPVGKLMERTLPTRQRMLFGRKVSLNPGPFNAKEHMLITIMAYAESIIITQRLPSFYDQQWASSWLYQILLVVSTQIIGYGFAGITRKSLVYPTAAIWPSNLPTIALNRSFHEDVNVKANGWRISRLRWFGWIFVASAVYFFVPNYLFTALSQFNWMTWIAPNNAILAAMTGSITGLGINPLPTFDYNIVSAIADPFVTPFYAVLNIFGGMLFTGLVLLPSIWFSNTWFTGHLPIVANRPFDSQGHRYNVSRILGSDDRLNITMFEDYSPVYLSAANALSFGGYFALYPATLVYAYLYHGAEIANAFKNIFGRGKKMKMDIHMRLMSAYKEVPEWWYLSIMVVGTAMAFIMIGLFPTDMPAWGIFFALAVAMIFIIPIGLIEAVSNVQINLNVLSEMVAGFAMPGKPLSMMIFKTYGTMTMAQGLSFASDLKLGHYSKIPPRTMFVAQLVSTLLAAFVTLSITNWQIENLEDFCLLSQKQKFSCPGTNTFFTSSVIFGVIGPGRTFGSGGLYSVLLWGLAVGVVLPIPFYFASKRWPKSIMRHVHPPIFLLGLILFVPLNLSYITAAIPVGYIFNVYIRKRAFAWWSKYNYITATGLSSGIAIAGLIAFVALQNPGVSLDWIGNSIGTSGCDQSGCPLIPLAPGGHFGPGPGEFRYKL